MGYIGYSLLKRTELQLTTQQNPMTLIAMPHTAV